MNFAVSLSGVIKSSLLLKSREIKVVNQWSTPLTPIVNNLTWSYVTASKKWCEKSNPKIRSNKGDQTAL